MRVKPQVRVRVSGIAAQWYDDMLPNPKLLSSRIKSSQYFKGKESQGTVTSFKVGPIYLDNI